MKRKILSIGLVLAFSVLLWVYVSFNDDFTISFNLPVEVIDIPQELALSSLSTDEISLTLKGKGWQLAQRTIGRDPKFLIPSALEPGEEVVNARNVLSANSWISSTLQLVEIHPDQISLKLEEVESKMVEIIPVIYLVHKPGYGLVSDLIVSPDSVLISGPKSVVKEIDLINTKGYTFNDLEDETEVKLQLENMPHIKYDQKECTVSFDIQKIVDKNFIDLVVKSKNLPSRYELILFPDKIDMILRGGINTLSKMKNKDLEVYVDFDQAINDTTGSVEPQLNPPSYTTIVDVKPNKLEYIIKKY